MSTEPQANDLPTCEPARRRIRWRRWLPGVLPLLVLPKCVACLLLPAAIATALGLGGPEMCRISGTGTLATLAAWLGSSASRFPALIAAAAALPMLLAALAWAKRRRKLHR